MPAIATAIIVNPAANKGGASRRWPAIQAEPPITCEAIPASCTLSDRCACLAQGTLERCWLSDQVSNLCICDNGIR